MKMGIPDNKVSIVTGGSSGIGLATASAFHREGARVVITGRDEAKLSQVAESIGSDILTIKADASVLSDIDVMVETVARQYDKIDVMSLNVGSGIPVPFEKVTEKLFDETIDANLKSAFFTIQKTLPCLSDSASIILNSSMSNFIGQHSLSVYAAAKAGLRSLARMLATELGPKRNKT